MSANDAIPVATKPAPGWKGGFMESNPAFAYPNPDLSSLPMLGNMDNIPRLTRQVDVLWPEFYWNTVLHDPNSRCFQMFAPDISRAGYDDAGRVWSIICPQQGAYSPSLGSLNIEVSVTGQRGWTDENADPFEDFLAADMTVTGKVWFAPSAKDKLLYNILEACLDSLGLPFPFDKAHAIQVNLHDVDEPNTPTLAPRSGLRKEDGLVYPAFTLHDAANGGDAWGVANVAVGIGPILSCNDPIVDSFNQMVMDIFNLASGNILLEGNVLTWNVWFDAPTIVRRTEWAQHAQTWRDSIDTSGRYPDGQGTKPRYADGSYFKPIDAVLQMEWDKISAWLKQHFGISLPDVPPPDWFEPTNTR